MSKKITTVKKQNKYLQKCTEMLYLFEAHDKGITKCKNNLNHLNQSFTPAGTGITSSTVWKRHSYSIMRMRSGFVIRLQQWRERILKFVISRN